MNLEMRIELGGLERAEVQALLREHLRDMHLLSPPESVHALDLEALHRPEITFWTAWEGHALMGCGALKDLGRSEGEVKSMRTVKARRRRGAGQAMLEHIVSEARSRGYQRLYLETGSMDAFAPARALYAKFGFIDCGPFADYREDPNSVFMTLVL